MLDDYKRKTERSGPSPKEIFPLLLNRLWLRMEEKFPYYLASGFRGCGLYPLVPTQVLKRLKQKPSGDSKTVLNEAVLQMSAENRKQPGPTRKRGKKLKHYKPGSAVEFEIINSEHIDDVDNDDPFRGIKVENTIEMEVDEVEEVEVEAEVESDIDDDVPLHYIWKNIRICYICESSGDDIDHECPQCKLCFHKKCLNDNEVEGQCLFCYDEEDVVM